MDLVLEQNDFIAAGCESELYHYKENFVSKVFYKKVQKDKIDFVYEKQNVLKEIKAVCSLVDRGKIQETDREFFIFEYIKGQTLSELTFNRSLSLFEAFRLIKKVTNIIIKMHQVGIVHGDIHGENVMMNELGTVTLIDLSSSEKCAVDDVVDICKLFHEVKYDSEHIPAEIKDLFPKKRDAILKRYKNVKELQGRIIELTR